MGKKAEQTTLARAVTKGGIGLHTGARASLSLQPAEPDTGVAFVTASGAGIPATADIVVGTERATALGRGGESIRAVEHLLAAIYAAGIDNIRIEIEGPEVPALDGSAREWVSLLRRAGRKGLGRARRPRSLQAPIWWVDGDSWAVAMPARAGLSMCVAVDFPATAAGRQMLWIPQAGRCFARDLAPARTFALEEELDALRSSGLARGGGMGNAFTVGRDGYSGPLRFPDEVVRHKAVDLIGDLALCGYRLRAQVIAVRPGHRGNVALASAVRRVLASAAEGS